MSQDSHSSPMIRAGSSNVAEMLSCIINLSEGGTYWEPNCPFCTSQHRRQAEDLWLNKDIMAKDPEARITAYFDSVGEKVSSDAVSNHVKNHMRRGDSELRKMEYLGRLANLCSAETTTPAQIKMAIAAVLECLTASAEIGPTKTMSAARAQEVRSKIVNSLVKSWADLLSLKAKIEGELEDKGEVITFPKQGFKRVFDDALTTAKTQEDKATINRIMDALMGL